MPTVPLFSRRTELARAPDVGQQSTRLDAFADRAQAGAGLVEQGQRALAAGAEIVAQERQKANQVRLLSVKNQYEERLTQRMAEWGQRTGLAAQDSIDEFREWEAQTRGELGQGLTGEAAQAWADWASSRSVDVGRNLTFRAAGEMKRYEAQQFEANGELFMQRVGTSYMDPLAVNAAMADRLNEIRLFGERNGMPVEAINRMAAETRSAMEVAIIERHLADDSDILASEHFERFKDNILPSAQVQVQARLEAASSRNEAFRLADDVFLAMSEAGGSMEEAMQAVAAQSGDNSKVREMAEQRIRTMFGDRERSRAKLMSDDMTEAATALIENQGRLDQVPPSLIDRITAENPEGRLALMNIANKIATGEPIRTDWEAWTGAMAMIRDEPEKFARLTQGELLTQYRPKLDDGDYQRLVGVWASMQQAGARGGRSTEAENFLTVRQQIDGAMDAGGLGALRDKPARLRTDADRLALVDFDREAGRRLAVAEEEKGAPLTMDDRQKVLDRLALESARIRSDGRPAPWQRRLTIREIRRDPAMGEQAIRRLRDRARALGNRDPDDSTLERAVEAARIGASAEIIDGILQGN